MRFVHTADVNWGMVPDPDMPWGKERANAIKSSFRQIIEKARALHADCLFIAGDLFHRPPRREELSELNALFSSIPSVHVVIISGNRDRVEKNAALKSFAWAENVDWLLEPVLQKVYYDDINTEVYGLSYQGKEQRELDMAALQPEIPGGEGLSRPLRVLLLHGGDDAHMPFSPEALSGLPYDYIALGHLHRPLEVVEKRVVYAGSPEPLGVSETGPHGIFTGDIHPITHAVTSLSFLPIAALSYIPLQIQVRRETDNEELLSMVSSEIEKRGVQNIYKLRLTGKRDPDVHFDLSALSQRFRIVETEDASEPEYDFAALYREHPSDMLGFYIRSLYWENEVEMSYVEKQALYYGVDAFLKTQD